MRDRVGATIVFLLALATRVAVIVQLRDEALFRSPQLDGLEYLEWGRRIAEGDFAWPASLIHAPGYPLFIGAILAATGSTAAIHVTQAIVGAISALLVFEVARRHYGLLAGASAGVAHAICAPLVLIEVSILAEGLLIAFLVAALSSALGPRPSALGVPAGFFLGLAIIVRPTAAILVPLFAWVSVRANRRSLAPFLIAVALPVVPVIVLNATSSDSALAVQTSGGMNFYIGNTPAHDGTAWARPGGRWDFARGMAWRAGLRGAANEDRFYVRRTLDEISADPAGFLRVIGSKLLWLMQDEEVRDTHSFYFFARSSALLRTLPGYGIFFALAIAGMFIAVRERAASPLALGYFTLVALTVVALVAGSRYRAPVMPALFIYAGCFVAWLATRARQQEWSRLLVPSLIFVVALAMTRARTHAESHDFSEELSLTALSLNNEGDADGAAVAARRAVATNSRNSATWVVLGDIEASRDDWRRAEHAWQQATRVDAGNARAWSHLALAYIRRGDEQRGLTALRRSVSIRADAEALHNLAVLEQSMQK